MGRKRGSKYPWYHKYIIQRINQVWGWCPERRKAKARATTGKDARGNELFRCELCQVAGLRRTDVEIDHKVPRVNPLGWDGYDNFIVRTFAPASELQILCKPCHKRKSEGENAARPHRNKRKDSDA